MPPQTRPLGESCTRSSVLVVAVRRAGDGAVEREVHVLRAVEAAEHLGGIGIATAQVDATDWDPDRKEATGSRANRAQAMRAAHEAAAYNLQLAKETQASIDDPRPGIAHEAVMAEMDAAIAALPANKRKRA